MSSLNAHRSSTAKKVRSGTLSSTASDQTSLMSMSSPTTSANKVKSTSDSSNSSRLEHLVRRRRTIAGRPPYLQESTHFEEVTKASTITDRTSRKTMITTAIEETNQIGEDDWVCPVAVALRKAGYNVPLRPSKSWLERDRKNQEILKGQQKEQ